MVIALVVLPRRRYDFTLSFSTHTTQRSRRLSIVVARLSRGAEPHLLFPADPSWNTATNSGRASNLLGPFGAHWSDFLLQAFGVSAFLLPLHLFGLGWKWLRSSPIESPWFRVTGGLALWFCVSAACGLLPAPYLIGGSVRPSGIVGMVIADFLVARFEVTGAAIITAAAAIIALYFASTFEVSTLMRWLSGPIARWQAFIERRRAIRADRRARAIERAKAKAAERMARRGRTVRTSEPTLNPRPTRVRRGGRDGEWRRNDSGRHCSRGRRYSRLSTSLRTRSLPTPRTKFRFARSNISP